MKRVRWLLTKGNVDVNAPNTYGMTPLHLAAMKGHVEICTMLTAEFHADIHQENAVGQVCNSVIINIRSLFFCYSLNLLLTRTHTQSALHVAKDRRVQNVLKESEMESKRKRNEERKRREKQMRDALIAHSVLQQQRSTFRGTSLAKQIQERLHDPVHVVANEIQHTLGRTKRDPEVEMIARRARGEWSSTQSRLRHARRVVARNRGQQSSNTSSAKFYRNITMRPESRHFVDCMRGAGWSFQ